MNTKPLTFLLAFTVLINFSTTVSAKQKFGDYEGAIYVRNYDSDTITFNLPEKKRRLFEYQRLCVSP